MLMPALLHKFKLQFSNSTLSFSLCLFYILLRSHYLWILHTWCIRHVHILAARIAA